LVSDHARLRPPPTPTLVPYTTLFRSPAQGVGADPQPGAADDVEVDDGSEVIDVVRDVVEVLGVLQMKGALEPGARDLLPPVGQIGVGALGEPGRGLRAGRSAVGWVVLDAAVGRRIVAGGDDDAIGLGIGAGLPGVEAEDRV